METSPDGQRSVRPRGRQAEASRNDRAVMEAAREVFTQDPSASMAAVADVAHVGIGGLYRRFPSKEALLRKLCSDGLDRFISIAEESLAITDAGEGFARFFRGIVEADVQSLTASLAGSFTPSPELQELAGRAGALERRVFERARAAGAIREDLDRGDLSLLFEQVAAIRIGDPRRTKALRRRYTELLLDACRPGSARRALPGPPPSSGELQARWRPRQGGSPEPAR